MPISSRGLKAPAAQPGGHRQIWLTNLLVYEMLQEGRQSQIVRSVREVGGDGSIDGVGPHRDAFRHCSGRGSGTRLRA